MKNSALKNIHLALIFKDLSAWILSSCVGLHVAGFTTAKYLREFGVDTTVFPVRHNIDIVHSIDKYNESHQERLSHVIISAPWLSLHDTKNLINHFKDIQFVILSHSNVGFLQADPNGVELFRKYAELSETHHNLRVGGNSIKFVEWFRATYNDNCVCLPNLYPLEKITSKVWDGISTLKIGAFGAIRAEKNFMTGAAAALAIHSILQVPIELHMIIGGEQVKSTTLAAIEEMTENIEGFKLVKHNWEPWNKFIDLVKTMDLLFQISYSESFNMVSADGISVGVPSVISPVIYWGPDSWKVEPDDALQAAKVGIDLLLNNQHHIGYNALEKHNKSSVKKWLNFLNP